MRHDRHLVAPARWLGLGGLLVVFGALVLVATVSASRGPTSGAGPAAGPARGTPNVILIDVDDMRYDSLWVMDRLNQAAERGTTFGKFFDTTPLCCPSRASLQTGLYARNHGVVGNTAPEGGFTAFNDSSTLATWLHNGGIRTGLVGRYLNEYTTEYIPPGWDSWFALQQADEDHGNYYDYRVTIDGGDRRYYGYQEKDYSERVLGERALQFIRADTTRPFFLLFTPRGPHGPATPDKLDAGAFKTTPWPTPPSLDEADVSDKPSFIQSLKRLTDSDKADIEQFRRRQWEALLSVDRTIGQMLDALAADGRLDNTWIFFTSDNGIALGEHRIDVRKSCVYEECVRVPLVVIPPAGMTVPRTDDDHVVGNIDLAPTVADIMGIRPGTGVDGRSLLPILRDPSADWREGIILEMVKDTGRYQYSAIRTSDRKYVRFDNGEEELYDEASDPYELHNLAAVGRWSDEKGRLGRLLDQLLAIRPS